MPRRPRLRIANMPFHVIQRGNNRSACFRTDRDRSCYLRWLHDQAKEHRVAVHAYVLMTNHVHLLLTPEERDGVPLLMKFLGQCYVQYYNRIHERSGTLWEGRFRSCLVDSERYLLVCHRYIETNPVRAGMVERPEDFRWSSHRANAFGATNHLLTVHPVIAALGKSPSERQKAYRDLFLDDLDEALINQIRKTTNGGFALGSEAFQQGVAQHLGQPAWPRKPGPKRGAPAAS